MREKKQYLRRKGIWRSDLQTSFLRGCNRRSKRRLGWRLRQLKNISACVITKGEA